MDKSLTDLIAGVFTIQTLVYVLTAPHWSNLSHDQVEVEVKKWADLSTENLLRALEKKGYTIVPKEIPSAFTT